MSRLRTPLCEQLAIEYPILSAGFAYSAVPELVAAVSGAGACGVLGGSSIPAPAITERVERTRALTDRPFGLNLIVAAFEQSTFTDEDRAVVRAQFDAALAARVPFVVLFWGPAEPFVADAHAAGVQVLIQVGSVEEAAQAAAAGVDAVIAQGIEAGGHVRGTTSIWELIPAVVEAVRPLPVLASGGIGDGEGVARALGLGAQGVSLGTRFVASEEAFVHPDYKRRIVESGAEDTVYGGLFDVGWPDAPHRVLRNRVVAEWEEAGSPQPGSRPGEGTTIGTSRRPWGDHEWRRYASGMLTPDFGGDPEYAPMWAGESCGLVNSIQPAADIVRDLGRDAEALL